MKISLHSATLVIISTFVSLPARSQAVEPPITGGWAVVSSSNADVIAVAKAAVIARDKHLSLVSVDKAEMQVVAGMNYKVTMQISDGSKHSKAEATVWHKLNQTNELTDWRWLEQNKTPAILLGEFIYEAAPIPSCHATTLAESNGTLVAAWFGGTAEGKPDVCIWSSRQNGKQWTAPVEVANGIQLDGTRFPCWNPVLFQPSKGPLLLFYKVGPSPSKWWGMLRTSEDHGATWSAAQRLPEGVLGPIKNKPIELSDGSLLCPTSTETTTSPSAWRVHFENSKDLGKTWSTSAPASHGDPAIDAIQPSLLFLGGDRIMAIGRTKQKHLFQVSSDDLGKTWGSMSLTPLPNPNSGTDAVTLKNGQHLLIYNHTAKGRSPLNLAVTKDGLTWSAALVLEDEPKAEFSYPAIIQTQDGLVNITYTWKRKLVRHVVVDPSKLELKPIINGVWPN